ncbi:MAG TPA: D-glycero-beta-D-manno-heptose 1-phosphate adenylyltransferase [Balneolaceae bacterium]|nr:D-glycero-beta-D-manno-heptose 1-phosphate adenylyltransferase [Balneolaceae bacterium]
MKKSIIKGIEKFKNQKVLVIGEAMLDKFLVGRSSRLNREAPVPIVDLESQNLSPGGASNAAVNVVDLGGNVNFISVIGDDAEGKSLQKALGERGVNTKAVVIDKSRRTLTKQRVMSGNHMLVRFDQGDIHTIDEQTEEKVINLLKELYPQSDAVIVSDYGYGVITSRVIQALKKLRQEHKKVLVVDSKYLDRYKEMAPPVVKPNYQEAVNLLGITKPAEPGYRVEQIKGYRDKLFELTGAQVVAVTVDIEGSIIFERGGGTYRTHTKPVENSKAIGAGDTYTSAFALSLGAGLDTASAGETAAASATIVAQKDGTATCTQKELQFFFSVDNKHIKDDVSLGLLIDRYKELGKKIVFTNGCFDILHSGHVKYLKQAKELGDVLIVGLNSDYSIQRLKGPGRPVNAASDRLQVLSALSSVDHVVVFDDDTPINLIKKIKPDMFVKGGDYTKETLPETSAIEDMGGEVKIIPLVPGRSTTRILSRFEKVESLNGS